MFVLRVWAVWCDIFRVLCGRWVMIYKVHGPPSISMYNQVAASPLPLISSIPPFS